jgi:hypothetical protein
VIRISLPVHEMIRTATGMRSHRRQPITSGAGNCACEHDASIKRVGLAAGLCLVAAVVRLIASATIGPAVLFR